MNQANWGNVNCNRQMNRIIAEKINTTSAAALDRITPIYRKLSAVCSFCRSKCETRPASDARCDSLWHPDNSQCCNCVLEYHASLSNPVSTAILKVPKSRST